MTLYRNQTKSLIRSMKISFKAKVRGVLEKKAT